MTKKLLPNRGNEANYPTPALKRLSQTILVILGCTSLLPIAAFTQEATTVYDGEMILEEVIVTGTRIIRADGFGRISPVTVVSKAEIESFGFNRIEEMLNTLPQVEAAQNSFISNGSSGTASLDLRGLGSSRTLVLINGRRLQPGGVYSTSPDVNQIPTHMIDRVEILTGGASAVYGADAVAGVVNFIMRRVDGVEISAGISGYQHNNRNKYIQGLLDQKGYNYPNGSSGFDGNAYNINIVMGSDFAEGQGNATVYANWRKNDSLLHADRDYSACALSRSGTECGGSLVSPVPNFWIAPITEDGLGLNGFDFFQSAYATLQPDSSLGPPNFANQYNFAPVNYYMRPDERWSLGAFVDYQINELATTYLEIMATHDQTTAQIAESGLFFTTPYVLPVDNANFPATFRASLEAIWPDTDLFGIYIGKRNVEGGPRQNQFEHTSFRIVAGLKGALNSTWNYDVSYLHAQTSSTSTFINDFYEPNIITALDASLCDADPKCIPYEVFTYQGVTTEAAKAMSATAIANATTNIDIFTAFMTGSTGWGFLAGDIMLAGGFEHREVGFDRIADSIYSEGLLAGQIGRVDNISGTSKVNELFVEANVPLLSDYTFAQQLTLDLAYRYSDYNFSGGSSTYRVGLDWQMLDWLRIRSGFNRAVRTPNVAELYSAQQYSFSTAFDFCSGDSPAYSPEQCARSGVTTTQYGQIDAYPLDGYSQINVINGGNPDLDPEQANTVTAGVVIEAGESMRISLDYWDIKMGNVIRSISADTTLEQCGLFDNLCHLISRAPNGSLWQGIQGYIVGYLWNIGEQHFSGLDLAWDWSPGINWNLGLIGSYNLKKDTTIIAGDPNTTYACAGLIDPSFCFPSPKWRHTASTTYDSNGFWSITGRWRYFSSVSYMGDVDQIAKKSLRAQNYLDLNAVFRFMGTHNVVLGVNNLLDKEPPLVGSTLSTNANTIPSFYDPLGRYLFLEVRLRW